MTKKSPTKKGSKQLDRFKLLAANQQFQDFMADLREESDVDKGGFDGYENLLEWKKSLGMETIAAYTGELNRFREEACSGFSDNFQSLFLYYFHYGKVDENAFFIEKAHFSLSVQDDKTEFQIVFEPDAAESDIIAAFQTYKESYSDVVDEVKRNTGHVAVGYYDDVDRNIRAVELNKRYDNIYDVMDIIDKEFPDDPFEEDVEALRGMIKRTRKIINNLVK
jgi:hypothetical protein